MKPNPFNSEFNSDRMVILLFTGEALGNFLPTSLFLSYIGEQNLDAIFPKLLR